jgi:hypothetical protein
MLRSESMDLALIQAKIKAGRYFLSQHAIEEANTEDLDLIQIETAILNGEILEQYSDTGRGPSCLILGFAGKLPIHVVCGEKSDRIIVITAYVPMPPHFSDPWTRAT